MCRKEEVREYLNFGIQPVFCLHGGKQGGCRRPLGFSGRHVDKGPGSQVEVFRFYLASTSDGDSDEMES